MRAERSFARLPPEQRVADILRAARRVFAEQGYDAASVEAVAELAGVAEGSVYRYFQSKRALLVKVVEEWYAEMLADYDDCLKGIVGTWNRLRYMVYNHLSIIAREPAMCRLVFGELRPDGEYRVTNVFALNREYTQRTLAILQEGIAAGDLREHLPLGIVRDMIYGGIEHHTWAFLRGEGRFSADDAADGIMQILRGGIGVSKDKGPELSALVARMERVAERIERAPPAEPRGKKRTRVS